MNCLYQNGILKPDKNNNPMFGIVFRLLPPKIYNQKSGKFPLKNFWRENLRKVV